MRDRHPMVIHTLLSFLAQFFCEDRRGRLQWLAKVRGRIVIGLEHGEASAITGGSCGHGGLDAGRDLFGELVLRTVRGRELADVWFYDKIWEEHTTGAARVRVGMAAAPGEQQQAADYALPFFSFCWSPRTGFGLARSRFFSDSLPCEREVRMGENAAPGGWRAEAERKLPGASCVVLDWEGVQRPSL